MALRFIAYLHSKKQDCSGAPVIKKFYRLIENYPLSVCFYYSGFVFTNPMLATVCD